MRKINYTEELFTDLGSRHVTITSAARELDISYESLKQQIRRHAKYKAAWEKGKENFDPTFTPIVKIEQFKRKMDEPRDSDNLPPVKTVDNDFHKKIITNDRAVLSAIRLGANLIHQIVKTSKIKRKDVDVALNRLAHSGAITSIATRKFTAYFPKESVPTGKLELRKTGVREVGDDSDVQPVYFCLNCKHATTAHYQFNLAMPCCTKGCKCRSCVSEYADINRTFRESKGFVDNLNPEFGEK